MVCVISGIVWRSVGLAHCLGTWADSVFQLAAQFVSISTGSQVSGRAVGGCLWFPNCHWASDNTGDLQECLFFHFTSFFLAALPLFSELKIRRKQIWGMGIGPHQAQNTSPVTSLTWRFSWWEKLHFWFLFIPESQIQNYIDNLVINFFLISKIV